MEQRLERIHRALGELIEWHEPKAMALEDIYFGKNVRSAMAVGQARGVAMLAAAAARRPLLRLHAAGDQDGGLRVRGRRQGAGAADGGHAARPARAAPPDHAADALAVAICHGAAARRRARARGRQAVGERSPDDRRGQGRGDGSRPDHVVIDAGGVGYRLTVSAETLKAVPATGREAFLHAELIPRDDSLALYGFASEEERDLFRP